MVATISIEIIANAAQAQRELQQNASKFEKFGSAMGELAVPAGIATAAIGVFAKGAVDAAATAEQAMGGLEAVFGSQADTVKAWAADSANSVGMSEAAYATMAAGIGGALTGMGVPLDEAAQGTHDLMLRAADLASVFGGTTEQAVDAVTSAFRGEYDSLQRLIPTINAASVEQKMAEEASKGLTFASEEAAKAHAIQAIIMEESANAAGNFAKEADTAEGAQQRQNAAFEDAKAALGEGLLPLMTMFAETLSDVANWVKENTTLVTVIVGVLGGLALVITAINAAMAIYSAVTTVASAVSAAWSAASGIAAAATTAFGAAMAFLTSPIMIVIAIIGAVIAAIVLLVMNWDTVKEAAITCWEAIVSAAGAAWDWIKNIVTEFGGWLEDKWNALLDFMSGVWNGIKQGAQEAWNWVKDTIAGVWQWIVEKANAAGETMEGIWNTIKDVGVSCWNAIKSAIDALLTPFRAVKDAVQWLIDKLKQAWDWASKVLSKIPFIGGMFGSQSVSVAGSPMATLAAVGVSTRAAPAPTTININGALDPVAVGRQIEAILRNQSRRVGSIALNTGLAV